MSRLLASVQGLSDSVAKTLDDTKDGHDSSGRPDEKDIGRNGDAELDLDSFDASILDFDAPFVSEASQPHMLTTSSAAPTTNSLTSELVNVTGTNPFYSQIPNIWTHEYQMGIDPYLTAINASAESSMVLGKDYSFTNSPFSDHIRLLQKMLKNKLNTLGFVPEGHHPVQRDECKLMKWQRLSTSPHGPINVQQHDPSRRNGLASSTGYPFHQSETD
ncbi:hypothetical protein NW766_010045 [Fusarium irregulare]|uniref:Uncharacterized protein n=1 Tax=Fusarium irregulare TaxID=2494466 RepID=A0A9W8PIU2_9HYPO|nr:hypothetical protein NW766_010045 [Fusarium irregulare]